MQRLSEMHKTSFMGWLMHKSVAMAGTVRDLIPFMVFTNFW